MAEQYELIITDEINGKDEKSNNSYKKRERKSKYSTTMVNMFNNESTFDKITSSAGETASPISTSTSSAALGGAAGAAVGQAVLSIAKSVGSFASSNVGNFTSNQQYQNSVDNIMSGTGDVIGLVSSIAAGAATGGPVGAAIAVVATLATKAISIASTASDIAKSNKEAAAESQRATDRLGYQIYGFSR